MGLVTGLYDPSKYSDFEQSLTTAPAFTIEGKLDYADIRHKKLKIVGDKGLLVACDPYIGSRYCIPYKYDLPVYGCFTLKRYRSFNIIYAVTDCRRNIIVSKKWREAQIARSADHMRGKTYWGSFSIGFVIGIFGAFYCYFVTLKPETLPSTAS